MNPQKIMAVLFIASAFINSCHGPTPTPDRSSQDEGRKYVALKSITYQPADIAPGTKVEILAYLEGRKNVGDTVYYYPFIAINQNTLDTIVILCPEITIDNEQGVPGKTSTSPLLVNLEKGVTSATVEPVDTSTMMLMSDDNLHKLETNPDSANLEKLLNPQHAIHIVVLDKKDTGNKMFRFKTEVGTLNFKKIPW